MARVLILYASVGLGHMRAGEALRSAFAHCQPGQVELADVLDYANPFFREVYRRSYLQMTDKLPALWSYVYEKTDREMSRFTSLIHGLANRIGVWRLRRFLREYAPSIIICTHFLPVEVLAARNARACLPQPLYCVLTDYAAHAIWAYKNVDGYFVATEQTRAQLIKRGVAAELIRVKGIPIDPSLTLPKVCSEARAAQGLAQDRPVVTLFGGGISTRHVRIIITELLQSGIHGTLVVVAGRNCGLQAELSDLHGTEKLALRILGFVDYVDDLVVASDVVITKAGALVISEVLGRGRPMIIIDPIPGQEEGNVDYLVTVGAAIGLQLPEHVPFAVVQLFGNAARLRQMGEAAAHVARPRAALDIAEEVLQDVGERTR